MLFAYRRFWFLVEIRRCFAWLRFSVLTAKVSKKMEILYYNKEKKGKKTVKKSYDKKNLYQFVIGSVRLKRTDECASPSSALGTIY